MKVDHDRCNPQGKATRGILVGNKVRRGSVKRGEYAVQTLDAPPGTHFVEYRWAGEPRRTDCRFAIQMWAEPLG